MGPKNLNKPKRSLGQNFFVNMGLAEKFIDWILETDPKTIVEIGPGRGFFTIIFFSLGLEIFAIEKDEDLYEKLRFILPRIKAFNEDVFSEKVLPLFQKGPETVCFGSLPYNISKKIIAHVAENSNMENFYFIIQKEVAEKYANKKKHSLLSLTNSLYFDVELIQNISPENFKPKPNVMSSFVKFTRNENLQMVDDVKSFKKYLRAAFKQPRKMLRNNLNSYGCTLEKRAEDLDLQEHLNLWKSLVV